jgi:hypothetical protein
MSNIQKQFYERLEGVLDGEQMKVVNAFLDYFGMQILDEDFHEFLELEGIIY